MKKKTIIGARSPKFQFICTDKRGSLGIWQTDILSAKKTAKFISNLKIYPWQEIEVTVI